MSRADSRARVLDAALRLIRKRGHATVTMAHIAKAARLSRQAVYLQFADRAELMAALAGHVHESLGLPAAIERMMTDAPTGIGLIEADVSMQARFNPCGVGGRAGGRCRPSNGCGGRARLAGPSQVPVGPLSRHSVAPEN
jgi:AcrR family transcriptional regulator